jgi:very-short-patch-repair endonuclease
MQGQATIDARGNARSLRVAMTDAERRLWSRLRLGQLGAKFRRQHPLGPYVVDFACLDPRLAIEVDGSQHLEQVGYDERRTAWLQGRGFRVLRFAANDVLANTDGVLTAIHAVLLEASQAPTPALPQRGRGKDTERPEP